MRVAKHAGAIGTLRGDRSRISELWIRWTEHHGSGLLKLARAHAFWEGRALMAGLDAWVGWCHWLKLLFHSNAAGLPFPTIEPATLAPNYAAHLRALSPTLTASPTLSPGRARKPVKAYSTGAYSPYRPPPRPTMRFH